MHNQQDSESDICVLSVLLLPPQITHDGVGLCGFASQFVPHVLSGRVVPDVSVVSEEWPDAPEMPSQGAPCTERGCSECRALATEASLCDSRHLWPSLVVSEECGQVSGVICTPCIDFSIMIILI